MALDLRILREIVQALLRVWTRKDGGDVLENVAQASTAPGDGSALAGTGYSFPSQPGVTRGDGAASQSPGTPSRPANIQTIPGRLLNAARLRAVESATQLGFGGTGTYQRPEDTKKGLSEPAVHAAIFHLADGESDMARKAPHQEKTLPEIRYGRRRMSPRKLREAGKLSRTDVPQMFLTARPCRLTLR